MSEAVMFGLALNEAIVRAASAHTLLVASDFDGTLAPLVNDPALAEANPSAIAALNVLAGLRRTHVAVISGRGLASLKDRLGTVHSAHLVGSHGGEFEGQPAISVIQTKLLRRMEAA